MNKIASLLAIIFFYSCSTVGYNYDLLYVSDFSDDILVNKITSETNIKTANKDSLPEEFLPIRFNLLNSEDSFFEAYIHWTIHERRSEIVGGIQDSKYGYRDNDPYQGYWIKFAIRAYEVCETYSDDICLLESFNGNTFLDEALAYTCSPESIKRYKTNIRKKEKIINASRCIPFIQEEENKKMIAIEKRKNEEEQMKLAVINSLKERCISYGFTGSNNIAACVQREAQHDYEIEQKEYELELARQQIIAQQNQQPVPTEVPWYLSILEAVSEGIAEGYERKALIQSLDARYQRKDIYRYCRPNC